MNLTEKEKQVVEYLKDSYKAEAILFVGSRAVGDFKPNSDWDIWVFTNIKNSKQDKKIREKYGLEKEDIDLYLASPKQNFEWGVFRNRLRFHKIVYDPKGIAKNLIKQANKVYKKGPEKWTKLFTLHRISKVRRYENKFKDLLNEKNYLELYERLADAILETTYVWWYGVRGEWLPRPQQMYPDLKKRDKQLYNLLKKISDNKTTQIERVKILKKIHRDFFNSKAYRKVAGEETNEWLKKLEK